MDKVKYRIYFTRPRGKEGHGPTCGYLCTAIGDESDFSENRKSKSLTLDTEEACRSLLASIRKRHGFVKFIPVRFVEKKQG